MGGLRSNPQGSLASHCPIPPVRGDPVERETSGRKPGGEGGKLLGPPHWSEVALVGHIRSSLIHLPSPGAACLAAWPNPCAESMCHSEGIFGFLTRLGYEYQIYSDTPASRRLTRTWLYSSTPSRLRAV